MFIVSNEDTVEKKGGGERKKDLTVRVSITCSSRFQAPGHAGQLQHSCRLRAGAESSQPWPAPRQDGALVPASGSAALLRSWAQTLGSKREGGENVFCFFSVMQITVKSCPPQPPPATLALAALPKKPCWPGERAAFPFKQVVPCAPQRDVLHGPQWEMEHVVPHVPRNDVPGLQALLWGTIMRGAART